MRILNWMQGEKLGGRKGSRKSTSNSIKEGLLYETHRGESNNWPHGLLAIGTFGDENLNQVRPKRVQGNPSSSLQHHLQDLTPEELRKLQKEFSSLLDEHLKQPSSSLEVEASKHHPSNIFLSEQSSFESETTKNEPYYDELNEKGDSFQHVMVSKGKEVCMEASDSTVIGRRTLSLLLKQIFVCRGGIAPPAVAPPLRIQTLESRMEKMLRIILHKKIYPQSSNGRPSSMKKYLRKRNMPKDENNDEKNDKTGNGDDDRDGSKWVQTDSEYIVLEI